MINLSQNNRFMLIGLAPYNQDKEKTLADFEELELLVHTFEGRVYAATVQNASRFDNATFIGKGKAQEVAETILKEKIDIAVINATVKPGQLYTLKKIFERSNPDISVWDRVDLILKIFSKHAQTSEAKLQIRLSHLHHMGPKIYGIGMELSQQGGGIGTRGMGETNTEIMRRHFRDEIRNIHKELKKLSQNRSQQMSQRKRNGLPTISIVGYTNSGKTTLFNTLGKKSNLVKDELFATLDSSVCKFYLPSIGNEVFLSDTIGFIKNLPTELIDSFKSTLMETVNADLLLHVIDVSDPWVNDKIIAVEKILRDLKIETKTRIYVFNKIDAVKDLNKEELVAQYASFHPQFISAKFQQGLNELKVEIQKNKGFNDKMRDKFLSVI
ncbi:GTPase HflX [Candidatus Gottesmanbacteria bacterium RIFCSPLOWO2_01_FULL_39_12b]|uniref:GTPase HflX n=1 Tax=Candidatus Gottesmanbacteria bacterium RIFCSPLOWO2_01_FULL_39_12b TaxID=1798388 RepID=A0A1F6AQ88_9BACT|nr:MAG: GTPase HflX [Candidatus Gottesmanbacteria bacterium RIFCSPLOWO2_01_FULL_39_12b]